MKLTELKNKNKCSSPAPNFARKAKTTASPREGSIRPRPSREFDKEFPKKLSKNLKTLWQNWCGARILILGFGREGRDTFEFLRKLFPEKVLGVGDRNENVKCQMSNVKKIKWHLGKNYLGALKNYDVIIKSPGIPFKILPKAALPKITTQTEIFFENCPGRIIGITGTKGKSTTASLIYQILKSGGVKVRLLGNIGRPVLTSLLKTKKDDVFAYELSSHQLYNLKQSPHVAVILNVYPEHLDYYRNFKEYVNAKANITRGQTKRDYLIYNSRDLLVKKIAKKSRAKKLSIQGKYYQLDIAAAKRVGEIFKIPEKTILKAIREFKSLPHRLEFVGKFKGIEFYNDSLSTIPETTIEALDFLGNKVQTLILGGFDRGLDFKKLARRVLKSEVKTLILFPTTGERILKEIQTGRSRVSTKIQHFFINSMKNAVKLAYEHTNGGKICLMSPASPSFGIFRDYREKGNLFKKWAKKLGKSLENKIEGDIIN